MYYTWEHNSIAIEGMLNLIPTPTPTPPPPQLMPTPQ